MSEMTDAQRRAATRKAKILARGNAGLQRLAQTARGEEADMLYGGDDTASAASSAAPSRPDTPSVETLAKPATATASTTTASSSSKPAPASASKPAVSSNTSATADHRPGWAPSTAASGARRPAAASASTEEEQMRQQLDAMMAMLGGAGAPGGMGGGAGGPPPDMANLLASLMGGAPPPGMGGMGGMGGPGLIGDSREGTPSSNPFGGMDPMQNPFAGMPGFDGAPGQNPFDAMAGMPGMAGMFPGMGAPVQPPSKAARFFPAIHALCVLALVVFVAAWWEPALYHVFTGRENTIASWAARWSGLAGRSSAFAAKILEPVVS